MGFVSRLLKEGTEYLHQGINTVVLFSALRNESISNAHYFCFLQGLNNIIHIDFDYRKEFIYWIDSTRPSGRRINRMRLNGSDLKVLLR